MHRTSSKVNSEINQDGDSAFDCSFDKREENNVQRNADGRDARAVQPQQRYPVR